MLEEYKRAINIHKITDGEYTDIYVNYHFLMAQELSYTNIHNYSEKVNAYYTIDKSGKYIIKFIIDNHRQHIIISEDVYMCLRDYISGNSYSMVMVTVNDYISNNMSLENYQTFFMSVLEYKMYEKSIK